MLAGTPLADALLVCACLRRRKPAHIEADMYAVHGIAVRLGSASHDLLPDVRVVQQRIAAAVCSGQAYDLLGDDAT